MIYTDNDSNINIYSIVLVSNIENKKEMNER